MLGRSKRDQMALRLRAGAGGGAEGGRVGAGEGGRLIRKTNNSLPSGLGLDIVFQKKPGESADGRLLNFPNPLGPPGNE
jgi:hypothetical protein